ncbi:unannotated protein [freshwater metagenome]|uniref:Unannotated protein n=1 Tax=freshwater metagenome TaxID=449393 RepID=A0A6J7H8F3_9ZZZZ|nr:hypothetical protein [Actinomycetota bacterium]
MTEEAAKSGVTGPAWTFGALGAVLAVGALLFIVIGSPFGSGAPAPTSSVAPTTTVAAVTSTTDVNDGPLPTDRVAYVTSTGAVLSGTGAEPPVQVASDAARGPAGLGAIAVAPTGDLIAYLRTDGALVVVPASGGEVLVLATDAVISDIGAHTLLAWDPTGSQISYIAVGTADMAEPRDTTPKPLSAGQGVYRVPLPEGVLGNVVKVVDRTGAAVMRIGDPSTRSMVGLASSKSDDLMLLESVIPGTNNPYTLAAATSGSDALTPTFLSADEPTFSSDGSFIIAVGPDKSGKEMIRIATDSLSRTTLVSADKICAPSVSPDSTRIVYGAGPNCSKLMLISARGGTPVEITPPAQPGRASYRAGELSWTADGRFIAFADCRSTDGPLTCEGPVTFLDPDRLLEVPGAVATTVATVTRPLLGDLRLTVVLAGPIEYVGTFPVDAESEGELVEVDGSTSIVNLDLINGDQALNLDLEVAEGSQFVTGQMTLVDPSKGINRSFTVLGTASVIGLRVASVSGIWISTDDLPFVSGKFRIGLRRG